MPKCCFVNPTFNDRLDLYSDTSTDDNPAEVFTISTTGMPGHIRTINGDETYRGQQLEAHLTHVVETPWRSSITADMRMTVVGGIYNGQVLNIEAVRPKRKPNCPPFIELYCKEREP